MTRPCGMGFDMLVFLLTCLLRGMTYSHIRSLSAWKISTHMPLARHDFPPGILFLRLWHFYSHASCEAWRIETIHGWRVRRISTHMPLARHDDNPDANDKDKQISTHMPLARHDKVFHCKQGSNGNFYSHASCEAWHIRLSARRPITGFLLTCLLRGMTFQRVAIREAFTFLLTCLLRGMTRTLCGHNFTFQFLLTCLLRGMTRLRCEKKANKEISTHMPLARHDDGNPKRNWSDKNFYSHASCEAWRFLPSASVSAFHFYSHASCEAWQDLRCKKIRLRISTHMPLARHDATVEIILLWHSISTHMPLARHDRYW